MTLHTILDPASLNQVPPGTCALGIMTKAPRAGEVKTRLVPPLSSNEAAEINACFLRDLSMSILQACNHAQAQGVGIYTPVGAEKSYESILPPEFVLIPQRGAGFGERIINATTDLFAVGFRSVCLINSDSPTVPSSSFAQAVIELAKPGDRVVLGPSDDGGYYLIGLKNMHRRMFEEIDWSTEHVLEQTKARAAEIKVEVCGLPGGFDVDDRVSLGRLCHELLNENTRSIVAPTTQQFLSRIIAREGRGRIWPT
ncbi:MAG: TIGR04282 family arsenosugar biosynthesis glycosyltransferase [Verrucomicrobiota bacterium]